jgi:hypothetical protein
MEFQSMQLYYQNVGNVYSIRSTTFTRYLYLLLDKCENEKLQEALNKFCEKYKIENKQDISTLMSIIKEKDEHHRRFNLPNGEIIGNLLFFIIYYMKQDNSLFAYMNKNLLLMKIACNLSGHIDNGRPIDTQVDNIMRSFDRIGALMELNKHIENVTKTMDDDTVYRLDANIIDKHDYDYLEFKLIQ